MPQRTLTYFVLFVIAAVPLLMAMTSTEAKSERSIPIFAVGPTFSLQNASEGDGCTIYPITFARFPLAPAQIVVTNEIGDIIALADLNGELRNVGKTDTDFDCVAEPQIKVPEALFYTVYLGEERIQTIRDSQFPIEQGDPEHTIVIYMDG